MKKSMIAMLTAAIMILSTMVPLLSVNSWTSINHDPTSWYTSVNGLLSSDYYTLYPYSTSSNLNIGLSKYGEMIDPYAHTGLRYGTSSSSIDPFASDVAEYLWNEGWVINITYSRSGYYKNLWAFALYSDTLPSPGNASDIGKDWQNALVATGAPYGGRKYGGYDAYTNTSIGYAYTENLTILYNGPRTYIAFSNTTIGENKYTPIISVYLTFIFDRVNKYVTVIKDIKLLYTQKDLGPLQVEFSNRGEWDLGTGSAPLSYAHIFENQSTSYATGYQPYYGSNATYDVAQIISTQSGVNLVGFEAFWPQPISKYVEDFYLTNAKQRDTTMETWKAVFHVTNTTQTVFNLTSPNPLPISYPVGDGVWKNDPMVFVNGRLRPEDYTKASGWKWDGKSKVTFNSTQAPVNGDYVWIVYKRHVVQDDMSTTNHLGTPWLSGEWDFDMSNANDSTMQFRGVSVLGIVGKHDASDVGTPAIDREVKYQLAMVFNPMDIQHAVEEQSNRWVEYSNVPINSTTFTTSIYNIPVKVVLASQWDQYNITSERVEDLTNGTVLNRYKGQYGFVANSNGTATFTSLTKTHAYKFLYSTYSYYEKNVTTLLTNYYGTIENGISSQKHTFSSASVSGLWTDPTGVKQQLSCDGFTFTFTNVSTTKMTKNAWFNYTSYATMNDPASGSLWGEWDAQPFKVYKENATTLETLTSNILPRTVNNGTSTCALNFTAGSTEFNWKITPPTGPSFNYWRDVYFVYFSADPVLKINVFYNATSKNYTVYASVTFGNPTSETAEVTPPTSNALYAYYIWGSYEEGVVGKNAATVDSAGLSMITAAFKDKEVEYGIAAEDIYDSNLANQIPWVMSRLGSGTDWSGYYYSNLAGYSSTDKRVGLRDDWCTTWPISSANIIGSGGPLANMLAYYGNDFASAFYGIPDFTSYGKWWGAIVPLSCWSALSGGGYGPYWSDNSTGYAVISVSEDLNGTVLFLVWGNWGRDTYYASQWFWMDGIKEFQSFPRGVNSIVLEIDYNCTTNKPYAYYVDEMLGTISEKTEMYDSNAMWLTWPYKGGIHFDP
jgi:hypothetical protein